MTEYSKSPEALAHNDKTGHKIEWNEDCELWACLECVWVDSSFVVIAATPEVRKILEE